MRMRKRSYIIVRSARATNENATNQSSKMYSSKMNSVVLLMIAVMMSLRSCRAHYILYLTFYSYQNPNHSRENGQCCDSQDSPPCPELSSCDNIFTVCAQNSSQSLENDMNIRSEECSLGYFRSPERKYVDNDNITFDTSNPVVLTGDIWPGSFQLTIQVYDEDNGNPDDFIDILTIQETLSPSSSAPPTVYTSRTNVFTLNASFRVECAENYYGEKCNIFCQPQNDTELGHYYCDSKGQRVCYSGYRPPDCKFCLNCTSTVDCSVCTDPECSSRCVETVEDDDNGVIAATVSVMVILVILSAVVVSLIIALLMRRKYCFSGNNNITKGFVPGDNPVYMSSADLNTTTSSSLPSPSHCSASHHSHPTDSTTNDELMTGNLEHREREEAVVDDSVCGSSIDPHSSYHGKLDPYGNYGKKSITRIAQFASYPELFDDSKYAEWSPPADSDDSDDVDSDCQSEYL